MKKQGKKWMLVVLALLAVVTVALPLVGCKNDTIAEPVRYTVKFSKGSDTVDETDKEEIEAVTLPADLTVVSGTKLTAEQLKKLDDTTSYTFYGWHDGETKVEEGYEVKKDVTLTAQWTKKETGPGDQGSGDGNQGTGDGTGSGDGNQGTGDGTGSGSGNQGTGDGTGSGSGNQGTGGETEAGGGTGTGDPEQPVTYTVSFKTNGGGFIDSQTIVSGQTATKPADPTLENNVFGGWYSDEELTSEYEFTTPVTGSFTLHAKWVERIEVSAYSVSSVIAGLTGDGSYILVAIGNWSSDDLSAIKAALNEKPTAKVNLDLSKATDLTSIGLMAFEGCDSLTSISIPEGVKEIRGLAFSGCSGLTSISIPSSVEYIGDYAFSGCSGLTSIDIPEGVTTIGDGAFGGCSSLNISVDEKNTKYSLVNGMLLDKEKTTLIAYPSAKENVTNVPTSVTTIMRDAFMDCDSLTSISIPEGVTTIGDSAFSGCSGLTSIDLSKATGLTSIGDYAFIGCSGLTSIDLSKATGLTTIGNDAFDGCRGLTSISIPSSVTSIEDDAFDGCSGATVKVEAENPPILGSGVFEDVSKILVPSGFVDTYKEKWSDYEGKIEAIPE